MFWLIQVALAEPWLLPSSAPLPTHSSVLQGGAGVFFWDAIDVPNPNANDVFVYDPALILRYRGSPAERLDLSFTLGYGIKSQVIHPFGAIRYNFVEKDNIRFGSWAEFSYDQPVVRQKSLAYALGLSIETGGEHLRFDMALPLIGGEVPGWDGLLEITPVSLAVMQLPELGLSGLIGAHTVRVGLVQTISTLSYRYTFAATEDHPYFIEAGAALDLRRVLGGDDDFPRIFRLEGGYRF